MSLPRANKDLGQHFLKDKTVIEKITTDFGKQASAIIEVGPGPAVLTPFLAAHKKPIKLFEMDERFLELLEPVVGEGNIVMGDALKQDMAALMKDWNWDNNVWLVSNLPYNISAPLTLKFIQCPQIRYMSLMYQKEVAQKIVPAIEKNFMGSLYALANTYFECKQLCKVAPGAFHPPPKVDSMVVSFQRKESPVISLQEFEKFEKYLRNIFQFKRKQLGGVLKVYKDKIDITIVLAELGIASNCRAEALSLEQIHSLYKRIYA